MSVQLQARLGHHGDMAFPGMKSVAMRGGGARCYAFYREGNRQTQPRPHFREELWRKSGCRSQYLGSQPLGNNLCWNFASVDWGTCLTAPGANAPPCL